MTVSLRPPIHACLTLVLLAATLPVTPSLGDDGGDSIKPDGAWVTGITPAGTDGQFIASTATGLPLRPSSVVRFDLDSPNEFTTLYEHPAAIWDVDATPDGKTIASVDYRGNLGLHKAGSEDAKIHESVFEAWCQTVRATADGAALIAGNEAGKAFVFDLKSDKISQSKEISKHALTSIAQSSDGKTIAIGDGGGIVHLLTWPAMDTIGTIKIGKHPADKKPEPKKEAAKKGDAKDKEAEKKDDAKKEEKKAPEKPQPEPSPVFSVAFADATTLLVGSGDRTLYRATAKPGAKANAIYTGKDWLTEIAVSDSGRIAVAEISGSIHLLGASAWSTDSVDAETIDRATGVWALQWNDDSCLIVGTRKSGVGLIRQSWDWSGSDE